MTTTDRQVKIIMNELSKHSPDACSKSVMENRRLAMAEKNLSHKREALANRLWQIPPRQ